MARGAAARWALASVAVCVVVGVAGCRDGGELLGRSPAAYQVTPGALDFGPTALGERRLETVRVANTGRAPFRVRELRSTAPRIEVADFSPFELAGGEARELQVTFEPEVEGDVQGALILHGDGDAAQGQIPVAGQGVLALAELRTQRVDFGRAELGTVAMGELTVVNPRAVPAPVRVELEGPDADEYSASAASTDLLLQPGESRALPLAFRPTRLGVAQAFARVALCRGCPPTPVELLGTGIASMLDISPLTVGFGRVQIGSTAEERVTVRNQGNVAFDFEGAAVLGDAAGVFALTHVPSPPGGRLPPGASVELRVSFTPRATGPVRGPLLQIKVRPAGSATPGPKLALTGEGGTPCLAVSPPSVDFGTVPEGMTATRWVDLHNRCRDEVEIVNQALSTQAGGYFTLPGGGSPLVVAGHAGARLPVAFTPRAGSSGSAGLLTLRVQQGGAQGSERIPLLGLAARLPPCAYELVPAALDFGQVPVGGEVWLGAAVRNVGTDPCFVSTMQVASGSDPEFFAPPMGSRLLQPGQRAVLRVRFKPGAERAYAGMVEAWVNHPTAGHPTLMLSGQGSSSCFQLSPTTVDFGAAKLTCPARTRSVVAYNRCTSAVAVDAASLTGSGEISITSGPALPGTIAPGGQQRWELRYAPVDEGEDLAVLRVSALGGTHTAGLLGEGHVLHDRTDRFVQEGHAKVDVLFVVDNSGSMMEEQGGLAQNFAALLSAAQGQRVDYRIAVTTTGIEPSVGGWTACPGGVQGGEAGRLFPADSARPRVIAPTTPDAAAVFAANVQVGVCHWNEQGLEAAYRALSPPLVNSADDPHTPLPGDGNLGFLRPDAKLAVVFVSDEDDYSPGTVAFYEAFFRALKSDDPTLLVISAVVGPQDLSTCPTAASSGSRYAALARSTGGVVESICTPSWADSLEHLSDSAFGPRQRFLLSASPASPAEVVVRVNGAAVTSGWTYDPVTNSVVFDAQVVPAFGSLIEITYPLGC
jgi:hypothetical protein